MAGESTTVVILGATGDLAKRKLLPALFNLGCKGRLPEGLKIVGYARSDYSDEAFREFICEEGRAIDGLGAQRSEWESFARNLHYVRGDVGSSDQMAGLDQRLTELETGAVPANRLFYLSLAPQLYEPAIRGLGASGIARAESGWRRAVVEKPFGRDLSTAQELNRVVKEVFEEEQLFRIDHYLGKETVQNLLVLRFANAIFEPLWHRNHVDNIQITVSEEVAVGDRGGYYDQSGVVRDMLQNHLLQLLTMVAMEPPNSRDSESLRDKKVEILKAIRRWEPVDVYRHTVRGQYRGYRDEKGVPRDSSTATYVAARFYIDNWRWQGVPFYLRTGKALASKASEITIQFKSPPAVSFSLGPHQDPTSNVLAVCIQPDEGIHLGVAAKVPDQDMSMEMVDMEFHYESAFGSRAIPEAYERLLQDALQGDPRLFIRSDHIEEAWRVVDPLLEARDDPGSDTLHPYEPGSSGPDAADALLAEDGRRWLQVCAGHVTDSG